jgi:hypothetical protein
MPALFIVLFGVVFLLKAMGILNPPDVNLIWPILVILAGLQMLFRSKCRCCDAP